MKYILWIGVVPLFYGIKLLWRWTVVDRQNWEYLPEEYQQGFFFRVIVAVALIILGLYLFTNVGDFIGNRY